VPQQSTSGSRRIQSFEFSEGDLLLGKYRVVKKLGGGWEGEVFRVREVMTGVDRAAKFFFPHRNENNRALKFYARKLHKLRHCPVVIQYVTQESLEYEGQSVTFLVSEFAEGQVLTDLLKEQPGKRLTPFEALHVLHALAAGMATVHQQRESHGDLHTKNVMVRRRGLTFEVKVIDFFQWDGGKPDQYQDDVYGLVNILYDCVGGARHYARQPDVIKGIVRGLKSSLIREKFRTAIQLRDYLDDLSWD
jgi:tRNA A-37 threonylcarbamoyl transferase component Bud32